jgi:hypothetical protein
MAAYIRRSVKSSPNAIKHHFLNFGSHSTSGVPVVMYSYVVLIKISNIKMVNQ